MSFKPPLTTAALHEIRVRQDPADITKLLWEIKRLRGLVLRANQIISPLPESGGSNGMILTCLRGELKVEPCVMDEEKRRLDTQR